MILGRTDMGITHEQLGAALGTTGSAISRIEIGTRPVTRGTSLEALVAASRR